MASCPQEGDKASLAVYFFFIFSSSAFCLALFSLTPTRRLSARACLMASNTLYFLSSSVMTLALAWGTGCLMGRMGPFICVAILQVSG